MIKSTMKDALFFVLLVFQNLPATSKDPTVTIIGDYEYEEEFLNYCLKQLEFDSNVYIILNFTNKLPEECNGSTSFVGTKQEDQFCNQVMIHIDSDGTRRKINRVIAHELVHAKQFVDERLVRISSSLYIWEDKLYNLYNYDYLDRPWERKALKGSYKLLKDYKKLNK